ncbi:RluA family pseudouridine synthase [Helicobacter cinaedi]|uniref:RluA family pseudouridine synthase n=1 Tax=Helicobacter cinaedi TaxID=213 RepID=UPI000CF11AE9|nr:RluA family pseudouridine synthase [Helicobacter cinaedi]
MQESQIQKLQTQEFIVTELDLNNGKLRLDSFLTLKLQMSKNQIQQLIQAENITLNALPCVKNGTLLKLNDEIHITFPKPDSLDSNTQDISSSLQNLYENLSIDILYEDDDILIINKPPHLVIHDAPSVKDLTLTQWLKLHAHTLHTLSGRERYGIIHRLDKQTSGVLCIAKSLLAYEMLPNQLKSRQMGRYYLAIIDMPLKQNLQVQCFMGRCPTNRLKMSKIHIDENENPPKGVRDSKSSFVKLATSNNGSLELIAIKLHTGRTHQIRTHLESLSRHILGDSLYGYKSSAKSFFYEGRILLHAYILYLTHPKNKQNYTFKAPILLDMLEFIQNHFTKELPNGCQNIMELLEIDNITRAFECFS